MKRTSSSLSSSDQVVYDRSSSSSFLSSSSDQVVYDRSSSSSFLHLKTFCLDIQKGVDPAFFHETLLPFFSSLSVGKIIQGFSLYGNLNDFCSQILDVYFSFLSLNNARFSLASFNLDPSSNLSHTVFLHLLEHLTIDCFCYHLAQLELDAFTIATFLSLVYDPQEVFMSLCLYFPRAIVLSSLEFNPYNTWTDRVKSCIPSIIGKLSQFTTQLQKFDVQGLFPIIDDKVKPCKECLIAQHPGFNRNKCPFFLKTSSSSSQMLCSICKFHFKEKTTSKNMSTFINIGNCLRINWCPGCLLWGHRHDECLIVKARGTKYFVFDSLLATRLVFYDGLWKKYLPDFDKSDNTLSDYNIDGEFSVSPLMALVTRLRLFLESPFLKACFHPLHNLFSVEDLDTASDYWTLFFQRPHYLHPFIPQFLKPTFILINQTLLGVGVFYNSYVQNLMSVQKDKELSLLRDVQSQLLIELETIYDEIFPKCSTRRYILSNRIELIDRSAHSQSEPLVELPTQRGHEQVLPSLSSMVEQFNPQLYHKVQESNLKVLLNQLQSYVSQQFLNDQFFLLKVSRVFNLLYQMIDKAAIDSISIDTICKVLHDSKEALTIINVPESIHVLTLFPLIYSLVVYPRRVLVVQRTDQASRLCRDTLVACDSSGDFIAGLSHDTDVPIVYISEVQLRLLIVENNCNDYGIIVFGGYHHENLVNDVLIAKLVKDIQDPTVLNPKIVLTLSVSDMKDYVSYFSKIKANFSIPDLSSLSPKPLKQTICLNLSDFIPSVGDSCGFKRALVESFLTFRQLYVQKLPNNLLSTPDLNAYTNSICQFLTTVLEVVLNHAQPGSHVVLVLLPSANDVISFKQCFEQQCAVKSQLNAVELILITKQSELSSKLTFVSEFFVRVILTDQHSCLLIPGVTIVIDRGLIYSNETSEGRIKCRSLDSISTLDLKQRQDFCDQSKSSYYFGIYRQIDVKRPSQKRRFTDPLMLTLNLLCLSTKPFDLNSQLFRPLRDNELKWALYHLIASLGCIKINEDYKITKFGEFQFVLDLQPEHARTLFTVAHTKFLPLSVGLICTMESSSVLNYYDANTFASFNKRLSVFNSMSSLIEPQSLLINDHYVDIKIMFDQSFLKSHLDQVKFNHILVQYSCLLRAVINYLKVPSCHVSSIQADVVQFLSWLLLPNAVPRPVIRRTFDFIKIPFAEVSADSSVDIFFDEPSLSKNISVSKVSLNSETGKFYETTENSKPDFFVLSQQFDIDQRAAFLSCVDNGTAVLSNLHFPRIAVYPLADESCSNIYSIGFWYPPESLATKKMRQFRVLLEQNDIDKSTSLPDKEARLKNLEDYKSRTRRSTTSNVPIKIARVEKVTVERAPFPVSPVSDAIFPSVNSNVPKGVSKKPKTAKPPKSSTSSRTLSKKELKEKKFFKTRPLTRRVYTPNPDLEKKIKAEKAKKRSRQSDQNFEKRIRSSTLQIPVNDENKILYKQLYDSIPGKSSRQKRRMMNFHLVGRHFLEAETLLQQSLIDRETDVGHLNGRKTKDKETVFGPKIDIPTPKVISSFAAEKKPKGTPKKGKQSKKPKKDLIAFTSEDEFDFNDSSTVMSIDIETRRKTDRPVTTISNSLKEQREQESKELKSMKDEEKEQWIQDQEVFMISAIFGHFNRDQFLPVDARVYTLYVTDLNSLRLPDFCTSVHNCVSELNLLEQFINFIVEMGPDVITGFNTTNFDLRVLDNRFNHYNLEIPSLVSTFQPDVSLSQFWNRVKTDHWFSVSCDCYLYARKFIASKRGFSLRCLSHFLLNETKFRLHTNEFLLPIDFISSKPQDVINYCFQDSLLALKLFLLFQRNKVIRPTYVTHKTTLQQIVKHRGLDLLLQYYAQLVQHLRINTSLCFKMFVINQLENDQELPIFTTSDFDHIQTLLKQISSEHYGITVAKGKKPQIDPLLQNFVNTEFRSIMEVHGYSFLPSTFSARIMQRISETMVSNLEVNLKVRYGQYVESFINTFFDKIVQEKTLSDAIQSVFRFRLRQVKNLFLQLTFQEFSHVVQNIEETINSLNNDLNEAVVRMRQTRKRGVIDDTGVNTVITFTTLKIRELFNSDWPSTIYPSEITEDYQVDTLLKSVDDWPQFFIKPSIEINNYLESRHSKTYNVFPLVRDNVPGFFEIDTQALWNLVRTTLSKKEINERKKRDDWNTITEIRTFSPEEQNVFWNYFLKFNRPFKKYGYKFNNCIKTDGFSATIELVREDCVGMQFKPDSSIFSDEEQYFHDYDLDILRSKRLVYVDPGKNDLLYFCSKRLDNQLIRTESIKRNQNYLWMRFTQNEWSRVSRLHQKIRRINRRTFLLSNGVTVEAEEAKQSITVSKSTVYATFKLYVQQKISTLILTTNFYCLKIWRIQKMQRYVHIQKAEEKLFKTLKSIYGNPEDVAIILGDNGNKTKALRHQKSTRSVAWRKFFKRHGYTMCLLDERYTSSKCPCCHDDVVKFKKVPNPKPWKREETPEVTLNAVLKCSSEGCNGKVWNRNKLACLNFEAIVLNVLEGHERPEYLS
ncbi:hypothetical protein RCL1_000784 [Eukaryota sp. TZLM3-RCL]